MPDGVFPAARACYRGARRLKNRLLNRIDPPLLVLAYHRVTRKTFDPHRVAVTPENFRAQMLHLRQRVPLVRFEADWSSVRGPAVAVTFDDGYADNLHAALPILAELGIPATFFVSTFIFDAPDGRWREFWNDALERLVLDGAAYPPRFELRDDRFGRSWPTTNPAERLALHDELHRCMLKIGAERRVAWLEQLRAWSGAEARGREENRPLDAEELRALAAHPLVTIGAHSVSHSPLAALSEAEQRREIVHSRRRLEELIDRPVEVFAYPYGSRREYGRTAARLCREAGFRKAATTLPGQVHRWSDPWQLPRQLVRNWDGHEFAAHLERFWDG